MARSRDPNSTTPRRVQREITSMYTHAPSVSTPAASTCLPLRLSSRMLTHGNQIGIEDHRWQDNLGRDNVQVVVFFSFLGIGALCKEIKRIERSEARLSLKHQRPGWGTKGKKRSDVTGIGSSYWVPAKVWVVRANAVYRVP